MSTDRGRCMVKFEQIAELEANEGWWDFLGGGGFRGSRIGYPEGLRIRSQSWANVRRENYFFSCSFSCNEVYIASWESNELENVILFKIKWYILSQLIFFSLSHTHAVLCVAQFYNQGVKQQNIITHNFLLGSWKSHLGLEKAVWKSAVVFLQIFLDP